MNPDTSPYNMDFDQVGYDSFEAQEIVMTDRDIFEFLSVTVSMGFARACIIAGDRLYQLLYQANKVGGNTAMGMIFEIWQTEQGGGF